MFYNIGPRERSVVIFIIEFSMALHKQPHPAKLQFFFITIKNLSFSKKAKTGPTSVATLKK